MIATHTKATRPDARTSTGAASGQTSGADALGMGRHISSARPIDFTADLHDIDGGSATKRGRIPGITPSPRLARIL